MAFEGAIIPAVVAERTEREAIEKHGARQCSGVGRVPPANRDHTRARRYATRPDRRDANPRVPPTTTLMA
jgi:hypothetical protein